MVISVKNLWAPGVGMNVFASSPNQDITFTIASINLGTLPGFGQPTVSAVPFRFTVANTVGGEPVDLTPPYTSDAAGTEPDFVANADYVTVLSYTDKDQYLSDVPWTVDFIGASNGDTVLEVGEIAEITLWLMDRDTSVAVGATSSISVMNGTGDSLGGDGGVTTANELTTNVGFSIEMKPARGAIIQIDRTTPPALGTVMNLR